MQKQFYAIGLKGWVQIRVGLKPPHAIKTSFSLPIETVRGGFYSHFAQAHIGGVKEQKMLQLDQVVHEGGRVLYTLPTRRFNRLTSVRVKVGEVAALPPDGHILDVLGKEAERARRKREG